MVSSKAFEGLAIHADLSETEEVLSMEDLESLTIVSIEDFESVNSRFSINFEDLI
jgi:hypothetical protein